MGAIRERDRTRKAATATPAPMAIAEDIICLFEMRGWEVGCDFDQIRVEALWP